MDGSRFPRAISGFSLIEVMVALLDEPRRRWVGFRSFRRRTGRTSPGARSRRHDGQHESGAAEYRPRSGPGRVQNPVRSSYPVE